MKKPEDFKKVWVWDFVERDAKEEYLLSELPDGRFVTFISRATYNIIRIWKNCSETDPNVKKKRYMTREEVLIDNLDHPRRLVNMNNSKFRLLGFWDFNNPIKDYSYIDIPENYHDDFTDLEVKKYEVEE